jgi:uncharacterized protein YbjT (DUF2867 family)
MAILITGGTGKTGLRLARLLQNASIPFLIASRKGAASTPAGMPAVTFDWTQPATYAAPFAHTFPNNEKIKAVYLISPSTKDPSVLVNAFVDVARTTHGVKRFVFLTGSSCEKGGPHVGAVWQHLDDIGVEYTVLRATWFMGAFRRRVSHLRCGTDRTEIREFLAMATSRDHRKGGQDLHLLCGREDALHQYGSASPMFYAEKLNSL